jgi:hypothetical protein
MFKIGRWDYGRLLNLGRLVSSYLDAWCGNLEWNGDGCTEM